MGQVKLNAVLKTPGVAKDPNNDTYFQSPLHRADDVDLG